jgi:cell wall-associated protease
VCPFFAAESIIMKRTLGILLAATFAALQLFSQQAIAPSLRGDANFNQWHMLDATKDGVPGTSANRAYQELLAGKQPQPVIVAIIDSGTETFHEDLRENIWVNDDEIPDNGIDDDKNGYVDDVHGWSFIGGKEGDVSADNLEFTRIYRDLKKRFGTVTDPSNIKSEDKSDYEQYQRMDKQYQERMKEAQEGYAQYAMLANIYESASTNVANYLGKTNYTLEEVMSITPADEMMKASVEFVALAMEQGFAGELTEGAKHYETMIQYQLNLEFDPRDLVGDNYSDLSERFYGNNHVDGPEGEHGTHVGGIVGAVRNNAGMNGVSNAAKLMVIRCVPNGDERDKDVANAIRYAADNGARVINMSFGKSYSPQKSAVDEAVRYAESKNVLLVHAAGNDSKNVDVQPNFPKDKYDDGTYCTTWLEIGASGPSTEMLMADFSNYGKQSVDVFAPGVDIFSTIPGSQYKDNSGTSMAAPVTSGVAAAILSYYPHLSASDVKEIIMKSATDYSKTKIVTFVPRSGMGKFFAKIFIGKKKNESTNPPAREFKEKKVKFGNFSVTGGVVNLYEALKLAETWKK